MLNLLDQLDTIPPLNGKLLSDAIRKALEEITGEQNQKLNQLQENVETIANASKKEGAQFAAYDQGQSASESNAEIEIARKEFVKACNQSLYMVEYGLIQDWDIFLAREREHTHNQLGQGVQTSQTTTTAVPTNAMSSLTLSSPSISDTEATHDNSDTVLGPDQSTTLGLTDANKSDADFMDPDEFFKRDDDNDTENDTDQSNDSGDEEDGADNGRRTLAEQDDSIPDEVSENPKTDETAEDLQRSL